MSNPISERSRPPFLFRLGKSMTRLGVRGGSRLCNVAAKLGMLDTVVSYALPRDVVFAVPFYRADNRWDARDVEEYEQMAINRLCEILGSMSGATLFDCGADIGIFSAKLCASSPNIARIFAFEPNRDAFTILARNIKRLPSEGHACPEAVGNVNSMGSLVTPNYDKSPHASFVSPGAGDIKIRTIDSLGCTGGDVVLKVDVEGGELEVLEGARRTIAEARRAAVLFEAHPRVTRRTGRDPHVCSRFLLDIRPFEFMIAETGASVSADALFGSTLWNRVLNILAITVS
jgi:FkbM family methyltransferase